MPILRERIRHPRAQRISRVHPQILGVVGAVDVLFVRELVDRLRLFAVRQTGQRSRQAESHVARIFALTERFPLGVFRAVEDLRQIARSIQLREALQVQQVRSRSAHERRMRLRRHVRNAFQQRHIFRMLAELVVPDQRAERSSAENSVLFFVHLLEQRALIELRSLFNIPQQFFLGDVQHPDLQPAFRFRCDPSGASARARSLPASGTTHGA